MCRSEWPAGSRPPIPAELTQGLPRSQSEGSWPAVESTLQFAELLAEGVPRLDSASYVTTGSYNTFELTLRAHGRSPISSFLLCSLFSDALGLPSPAYLDFPAQGNGKQRSAATVRCSQRSRSDRRTSCFGYRIAGSTLGRTSRSTWWGSILSGRNIGRLASVTTYNIGRLASVTEAQALHWAARPGVPGGVRF